MAVAASRAVARLATVVWGVEWLNVAANVVRAVQPVPQAEINVTRPHAVLRL